MAEEHRCEAPEGHRLCANNCGFFGSLTTMNLCSKCYSDFCLKEKQQEPSVKASLSVPSPTPSSSAPEPVVAVGSTVSTAVLTGLITKTEDDTAVAEKKPNRCSVCKKRVGLTGFRCRCESLFCGVHRYPEKHNCTFDFKKIGREEIARANPLVVAVKLHKI